jgi:hypothetical protein
VNYVLNYIYFINNKFSFLISIKRQVYKIITFILIHRPKYPTTESSVALHHSVHHVKQKIKRLKKHPDNYQDKAYYKITNCKRFWLIIIMSGFFFCLLLIFMIRVFIFIFTVLFFQITFYKFIRASEEEIKSQNEKNSYYTQYTSKNIPQAFHPRIIPPILFFYFSYLKLVDFKNILLPYLIPGQPVILYKE